MSNLTSTLTVRLTDDVSGPASKAAGALHKLGASGADLKKLAAASPDTARLVRELEKLQAQAGKIKAVKDSLRELGNAGDSFRAAKQNVGQLTTALVQAEKKLASLKGVRGAEEQRQGAAREVQSIKRELRAATGVLAETKSAYLEQGRAVRTLQGDLAGAGVGVRGLHKAEAQLGAAMKATNATLAMRAAMLGPGGKLSGALKAGALDAVAARMGEGDGRRQAAARDGAHSSRMIDGMGAQSRAERERAERKAADQASVAERRAERRAARGEATGIVGAALGVALGHGVHRAIHASLETYREFDKERRFGKAVMGLSDAEQAPLVDQAVHMGASTRYNDVQVLESQRELAARGLKKDQVMGLMGAAADLGQSLDLRLPDAVKQMEGAMFGFKKPMDTLEQAMASARQTADLQVKAAKISGMTPEDISQTYKYGATPARMSGMSEQSLLAFAGVSKKANMGGDEAGVAFRALIASGISPTRKAKEAYLANGMDFKNYQKNPDSLALEPFVKNIAAQYGVKLNEGAQKGLGKIFSDKSLISDPSKFTPAVMSLLGDTLGKGDAKSKKSIAGAANRYRDASMQGVDMNKLWADLMQKLPGNLQLANAIFGSKQGARIATALADPEIKHMVEELLSNATGYAAKIAAERMAGYDGAVTRLSGAAKNLETAVGRAWDNGGSGGFLTKGADLAGKAVQGLAELDAKTIMASTALVGLAGSIGTVAGSLRIAGMLMGLPALTALGGLVGVVGALTLAATAAAGALYALSDEKKGIVHGGKPDVTMNPGDELPGLPGSTDAPSWSKGKTTGLPRMSLLDGVPSLVEAKKEGLPAALAQAREEAAALRKELAAAKSEADGLGSIAVPGLADGAKAKVAALEKRLQEANDRERSLRMEGEGRSPSLPPGASQPASRAAEGVKPAIEPNSGRQPGLWDRLMGKETIAPKVDASGLDPLKVQLGEVAQQAGEVNALTIRPQADGSGLGTIISQLQQIIGLAGQANAATAGVKGPAGGGRATGAVGRAAGNNQTGG